MDEVIIASPTIINSGFEGQGFIPVLLENFPLNKFLDNIDTSSKRKNSLIYHGNFGPERGIIELIKAMSSVIKSIPDISLSLFGGFRTNEYKYEVNNTIDSLGLRSYINLEDHILHRDIWEQLGKNMIGKKLFALSPLKNISIPVEVVSSHYVDPKGERVRS